MSRVVRGYVGPGWAWTTIWDTLKNDAKSTAFDKDLREQIKKAMEAVTEVVDDHQDDETEKTETTEQKELKQ
jgi:hypothetical protein